MPNSMNDELFFDSSFLSIFLALPTDNWAPSQHSITKCNGITK